MTRAAVFDLDGTLVDTPRAIVATLAETLATLGVPAPEQAAVRATIGLPLERAVATLAGVAPADPMVAEGVARYQARFRERVLPYARELVFPGAAAGLTALRREGFALAVATSKWYASADALLVAAGLREQFEVVAGADQVTRPKPDPELARLVLRRLGASPGQAVMVGDTTHDLLMANAAGMRSIGVTYGVHPAARLRSAGPTWLAGTFDDVVAYICKELT